MLKKLNLLLNKTADLTEITDVTESFDFSGQSQEYAEAFRKWRNNADNPYAYGFKNDSREVTFSDEAGFVHVSPKEKEYDTLKKVLYAIGSVILISLFNEIVLSKIVIEILSKSGVNIHTSFINYSIYGGKTEIMLFIISMTLIQYIVPFLILKKVFRMPLNVALPSRLQSGKNFIFCLALGLTASVISSISRAYSQTTREFFTFFNGYGEEISLLNQYELIIYIVFDIFIVSIISEILFSGIVFQSLRQFGDLYAIIVSALLSTSISHDIHSFASAFMVSIICALSVIRTGTVFTAFFVRAISKTFLFGLTIIELSYTNSLASARGLYMASCFIFGIIIVLVMWYISGKKSALTKNVFSFISMKEKFKMVAFSPVISDIIICAVIIINELI